jgi:hypothetical protein
MRSIRRVGGLAVAGLLLSAVAGGTAASADTPAAYAGSAAGYALRLSALGQTLTAGGSEAKAASTGASSGTGTGASPVAASIITAANPPGETKPEACAQALPPAQLQALPLDLGLGCAQAAATGSGLNTVGSASGKVAKLDVDLNSVLSQVPVTPTITSTLTTILDQICAGIPAQVKPQGCAVTGEAAALVQSLASTQTLGSEIGSSTSGVSVKSTSVTSESTASGAVIKLLPNATLNGVPIGEPLVTITISRAEAKVVCDMASGTATPTFDPAIVRVKFSNPLAAILPNTPDLLPTVVLPSNPLAAGTPIDPTIALTNGELTVTPGSTLVLFPGLPLQTEIVVGAGSAKVNPDKSATAMSDGVKVHALQLAPSPLTGGLLLNLAHAEAAGGCVAAVVDVVPPTVDVPRELPRTGGTPWLPMAGAAALLLAVAGRRALTRSH